MLSKMSKSLSIGLVGCGKWGKNILRDLISLGCQVIVVDTCAEARKIAVEKGASHAIKTIEDLPQIDGAIVAAPTDQHAICILELVQLQVGIKVFSEKPLTNSSETLSTLLPYQKQIFVMDKWRYHNGILALAQLAKGGQLGAIQSVQTYRWNWKVNNRSVNAIWTLAPHDLTIGLEILGYLPPVAFSRLEYHNEEISGAMAVLGKSPYLEIHVSESKEGHFRQVRIQGTKGMAILEDSFSDHIKFYQYTEGSIAQAPKLTSIPIEQNMPLRDEIEDFINYLQGGSPPKSNFQAAAAVVRTIEAIHANEMVSQ